MPQAIGLAQEDMDSESINKTSLQDQTQDNWKGSTQSSFGKTYNHQKSLKTCIILLLEELDLLQE